MKVFHDFRCEQRHVHEHFIQSDITSVECPTCSAPSGRVFLQAPKIDWLGMAQGENAGPEFIDRFTKIHDRETERQTRTLEEHGDYGPGYQAPPSDSDLQIVGNTEDA